MNKKIAFFLLFLVTNTTLFSAQQEPIPSIERMVQKVLGQLFHANGQPRSKISTIKVRNTLSGIVDWNMLVRRALGKNWAKLSPKEQQEVVNLTSQLIVKSYTNQLHGFTKPTITYGKVRKQGGNRLTVDTKINVGKQKFRGDYRFVNAGGKWKCYDFLVEGASVVSGYRSQFDRHFRKGNGNQLIRQLKLQL